MITGLGRRAAPARVAGGRSALVVVGHLRRALWDGHLPYFDEPFQVFDLTLSSVQLPRLGFELPRLSLELLPNPRKLAFEADLFETISRPLGHRTNTPLI